MLNGHQCKNKGQAGLIAKIFKAAVPNDHWITSTYPGLMSV